MSRFFKVDRFIRMFSALALACTIFVAVAYAQAPPPENVAPSSAMGATTVAGSSSTSSNAATPTANSIAPGTVVAPAPDTTNDAEAASTFDNAPDNTIDAASLLPTLPALRTKNTSLVGGRIEKLDRLRDQFTLQIFGGGKMKVYFDPRTHIYNNGAAATVSDLRPGDRVSIDTVLDGSTVFARSIRLKNAAAGEGQGTVVSFRSDKGELILRDGLSPRPLKLHISSQTRVIDHDRSVATTQLLPGTLVAVKFGPQQNGSSPAREVSVLATPGASFTFVGRVTALDLSTGMLVIDSATDGKTYEIYLDPSAVTVADNVRPSAGVTVQTQFDGKRYIAQTVTVN
jgi:hypothetical protein